MFEHLHPSIGKSEPDEFYIKAATQEEYERGSNIFHSLVKKILTKNLKKNAKKIYKRDQSI